MCHGLFEAQGIDLGITHFCATTFAGFFRDPSPPRGHPWPHVCRQTAAGRSSIGHNNPGCGEGAGEGLQRSSYDVCSTCIVSHHCHATTQDGKSALDLALDSSWKEGIAMLRAAGCEDGVA